MTEKKKPGRPVKYVYLDKYERNNKHLEDRIDLLENKFIANQKRIIRILWVTVAILCVGISIELFLR